LIFKDLDYKGLMTPPSVQGTLLYPGPAGGMNWGSVAIDEERKLMVVNALHLAYLINMVPREKDLIQSKEGFAPGYGIGGPQRGTPFAAIVKQFTSPLGLPCIKPPYGEIAVVDLNTQEIVWRRGTGFWDLGFPSYSGGSIITKGGLIFNGSIIGGLFRAIDVETGKQLWSDTLLTQSDATPMSYVSSKTGRQYVLVTVPLSSISFNEEDISQGSEEKESSARRGGLVIAYSLPE
jgi:glucose dehydrogenase